MEEIGIKQQGLRAIPAPHVAWTTPLAVVAGTALVALCAHIAIPLGFTPVPITMQTFAVLLLGLLLSPGAAFACLALYLVEGALGAPVFSPHGPGGLAQLLGPTGGYLFAYPVAAALTSFLYRLGRRRMVDTTVAAGLGTVLILVSGSVWLAWIAHVKIPVIFAQSVAPFLAGDAIKAVAAAACVSVLGSFSKASQDKSL